MIYNKMNKKERVLKWLLLIVLIIFILNFSANIVRILFIDRLSNVEVYHYPKEVSIVFEGEERVSSHVYYINTYLYRNIVHRMDKEKALEIIDNPKVILNLDGNNFYLSDNNEIVFPLHTQMIRKRSIIDRIFMMLFYSNENYLYYSTNPDDEHFENVMTWFRLFEMEESVEETIDSVIFKEQLKEINEDDFLSLMNKKILKVEINPESITDDIDFQWLEDELKFSQMAQIPDAIVSLDLQIELFYEDGTAAILRLLDLDEGICTLRYGSISYPFRNEKNAQWLNKIS